MLVHADSLWIATRKQGRTGRRTNRGGHHEARELTTFLRDAVDIRRTNGLGTKTAQVAVALIIGEDNYEIGLGSLQSSRDKKESSQRKGRKKFRLFHVSCLEVGCFGVL